MSAIFRLAAFWPLERAPREVARLFRRHERTMTAVLLGLLLSGIFYATDFAMAGRFARGVDFWSPVSAWDALVPFSPGWIWPYLLYVPFCCAPLLSRRSRSDIAAFRAMALGFALQFVTAFVFFWLLPSRMQRPEIEIASWSLWAVSWLYRVDPGFNIFPSLHVANAVFVACLLRRWVGPAVGAAAWVTCALISLSTIFVKQHYLADMPTGALLGLVAYRIAFPAKRES